MDIMFTMIFSKTVIITISVIFSLITLGTIVWYLNYVNKIPKEKTIQANEISYVALGDSYTIGLGISQNDRWPNVLTEHLKINGLNVKLAGNPSVSGYTVKDAILNELPIVQKLKPHFVTVLIGANDNFTQIDPSIYKQDLNEFLNKLQPMLKNPKNIVLITVPDHSKTPSGSQFSNAKEISESVEEYNLIIKEEAANRGLKVADIFPISQTMTDPEDFISDGLHPSAQGYAKWERIILPVVLSLLEENK